MFLAAFNPTTLLCLRRLGPILLPYHCKTTAKLFIIDERFQQQSPGPMFPVIIGFVVRCSVATRKPECKDIEALAILSKSITSTRDCLTCLQKSTGTAWTANRFQLSSGFLAAVTAILTSSPLMISLAVGRDQSLSL